MFNALFSIKTENWEFSHVTMTALAVGDATPTILAFTALTAAEVEADAEPADDVAPSTAVGGEQPTTMHDSTKPATINAIRILASIDAHTPQRNSGLSIPSVIAPSQSFVALRGRTAELELDR
ncbi:MAG: hypothetical protein ACOYM8_18375 [Caulobacterales bacterium]